MVVWLGGLVDGWGGGRAMGMDWGSGWGAPTTSAPAPIIEPETGVELTGGGDKPLGFEDGNYRSRTKLGSYRPFRHRGGPNRAVPPGTKRTADDAKEAADAR